MKVVRNIIFLLTLTLTFGTIAAQDEAPADTTVSREISDQALEELFVISDTLQARIIKGLADGNLDSLRAMIPDDLGIVLPDSRTASGMDVKGIYWPLIVEKLDGTIITANRHDHVVAESQGGWVKEKLLYEMTMPTSDSTTIKYAGHFLLFWQIENGEWHWRRLFVARH